MSGKDEFNELFNKIALSSKSHTIVCINGSSPAEGSALGRYTAGLENKEIFIYILYVCTY